MFKILIFFICHWYITVFFQTFFLHRYASHRQFSMSFFWERVFYVLTYLAQGASFLTPRAYAILHNNHHKYSDTKKDPHSPHYQSNIFGLLLKMLLEFESIRLHPEKHKPDHDTMEYPDWPLFERLAESYPVRALWLVVIIYIYFLLDAPLWAYILVPLHGYIGPLQGGIVNWFGHKNGYVNFKMSDKSRNSLPIDFILMGELYQNNHHRYPLNINFSSRWFEVDVTYYIIRLLGFVGIINLNESFVSNDQKALKHST